LSLLQGSTGRLAAAIALCACIARTGCGNNEPQQNRSTHLGGKTLSETVANSRPGLLTIAGVVKVEEGMRGTDSCIRVLVTSKTAILTAQIPLMIETWPVDIVEMPK